ncbi:unnamed protein product, partial [Schistosoma curassoni]|uniref:Microtubule-associated protein futsch n=1 Tax=Schistosoma curassoni TaxID=6186 RepID=A0A183L347_9TREM
VEQVEETLADGTIITRLITTKKVVDRVFERSISEEQSVSSGVNEELFVETDSTIPEVSTTEDQFFYHDQKLQEEQNNDLSKPGTILPNLTDNKRKEQITISETGRKTNDIKDILTENEIQVTQSGHDGKSTHVFKEEYIISAEETEHTETRKNRQLQHATLEQEDYTIGEAKIEENTNETERKIAAIKTNSKDLEEIDGGAIKKSISKETKCKRNILDENQIQSEIKVRKKIKEREMKESKIKKMTHMKRQNDETDEKQIHENQQTKTYELNQETKTKIYKVQKEEEKAKRETYIKGEREIKPEYGEVGEGVFEGETEAESAVEVF